MAVSYSFQVQQITFNSVTYDSTSGGPLMVTIRHSGDPLEGRSGADEYAAFLAVVDKIAEVQFSVADVKFITALGTSGTFTCTLKLKSTTVVITLATMVLVNVEMSQRRASLGEMTATLRHESANGTTVPVS